MKYRHLTNLFMWLADIYESGVAVFEDERRDSVNASQEQHPEMETTLRHAGATGPTTGKSLSIYLFY